MRARGRYSGLVSNRTVADGVWRSIEGRGVPGHPDRLAGQVCVITGAAGVIAEAVAERLKREGSTVVGMTSVSTLGDCPCRPTSPMRSKNGGRSPGP